MTLAWRAFLNMLAIAAGDPVWALTCVVFGPFRASFFIGKCLAVALIVALVLLLGVQFAVEAMRLKGAWPHSVGNIAAGLVAFAVFLRFVSRPMIDHFGDVEARIMSIDQGPVVRGPARLGLSFPGRNIYR